MLNEEVRRIMTKDFVTVSPEDRIDEINDMMHRRQVQQVPVVEGKVLVGMVTTYDLWQLSRKTMDTSDMKVRDVMTTKVLVITPKDKVGTAAELFMDKRFKTIPVVNLRHELKGVITAFDVIRHTLTREYPHPILYSEVFEELEEV
jgi:predicted transcriptional regulator